MDKLASFIEQNSLTWAKPNWIQPCSFKTPELPALQETINAQRISLDGRILWCDCLSSKGWDISSYLSDAWLDKSVSVWVSINALQIEIWKSMKTLWFHLSVFEILSDSWSVSVAEMGGPIFRSWRRTSVLHETQKNTSLSRKLWRINPKIAINSWGLPLNCQTHLYDFIQGGCLLIAGGCRKSPGQREKQCATERNLFFSRLSHPQNKTHWIVMLAHSELIPYTNHSYHSLRHGAVVSR